MKSIPGWKIKYDEISNGAYKVTLTDSFGHKAEVIDSATEETIEKAKSYAFDIERQISKNWSLFLYKFCLQLLDGKPIVEEEYNRRVFGCWFVNLQNKRITYDGKDFWLYLETKQGNDWINEIIIKNDQLTYSNFIGLINNARSTGS